LISFLKIRGEMNRGKIAVGFADHLTNARQTVIYQESPIDPEIPAFSIFHPCLHIRHDL